MILMYKKFCSKNCFFNYLQNKYIFCLNFTTFFVNVNSFNQVRCKNGTKLDKKVFFNQTYFRLFMRFNYIFYFVFNYNCKKQKRRCHNRGYNRYDSYRRGRQYMHKSKFILILLLFVLKHFYGLQYLILF